MRISCWINCLLFVVKANVDNIPSNRIEEGNLRCFLNKLDNVENKIDNIPSHRIDEGNLRQLFDKLVSVENKIDTLGKTSRPARRENINDRPSGASSPSVNNPRPVTTSSALGLPSRLWSEAAKSPTTAAACSNFT